MPDTIKLDQLPQSLRDCPRWLNWALVSGNKVPLDANTGRSGSTIHPATWASFERAVQRDPQRLGLVIGKPFFAVDLDDCFRSGLLTPPAKNLLLALPQTYTEVSPSGNGLHLWYGCDDWDALPKQSVLRFEVYKTERYFTMTGDRLPAAPRTVTQLDLPRAEAIFALAAPLQRLPREGNGEPGYWDERALLAMLEAWREQLSFKYERHGAHFWVPCPGNTEAGWDDGNCHSKPFDPLLSRNSILYVENGWATFNCFHAHCQQKTWKHFREFYDPERIIWDFDTWIEAELERRAEVLR